jgi:hypothetical protein
LILIFKGTPSQEEQKTIFNSLKIDEPRVEKARAFKIVQKYELWVRKKSHTHWL